MKWSHIFWLALAALLLNVIAYWSISAPAKISDDRMAEIGRQMTHHGIKEAVCDADGKRCWFYRDGRKIRL
jgi:hypothetical protein